MCSTSLVNNGVVVYTTIMVSSILAVVTMWMDLCTKLISLTVFSRLVNIWHVKPCTNYILYYYYIMCSTSLVNNGVVVPL